MAKSNVVALPAGGAEQAQQTRLEASPELVALVREWRKLDAEIKRLALIADPETKKPVVSYAASVGRKEGDARKEIGEIIGGTCAGVLDDKMLMVSRSESSNPTDKRYEVGWSAMREILQTRVGGKLTAKDVLDMMDECLPDPTPRVSWKLVTE